MSKLILFNKPFQVLSQFSELDEKVTLKHYLNHPDLAQCYPAGRLDYDSEGLLLLTDDGKLQHHISDPKHKLPKSYWVQVEGSPSIEDILPLKKGIVLKDGPCKPAQVQIISAPNIWDRNPPIRKRANDQTTWLNIVISEGRNRQVRRMCAAIGFPCLRLIRHRIGNWSINGLDQSKRKSEIQEKDNQLPLGSYRIETVHLPETALTRPAAKTRKTVARANTAKRESKKSSRRK